MDCVHLPPQTPKVGISGGRKLASLVWLDLAIGCSRMADPSIVLPNLGLRNEDEEVSKVMPKVKTNRVKYPEGWELIEPTLSELQAKMREAENDPHDGKRKCEALWPIFKIAHQKSRYIFDLFHRRKEISKELYEFCMDQGYADRNLIAKWKKPGYERLCCLRCMQPRDHNFQTTCVCRVPQHLREEKVIECVHCGCKGCASGD
ncbi:Protein BUD31 -like protein [Capsicum annuum]|nr:Protein BUD31 -like protein [Capsicum annuum]KAF3677916.1 Protein BUD31 -like protein [Capsicum annuum]